MDCDLPCLIRRIQTQAALKFSLWLPYTIPMQEASPPTRYAGRQSLISVHPAGSPQYGAIFRSTAPQTVQVVLSGMAKLAGAPDANGIWTVVCSPGQSEILIAGGPEYPDCIQHTEAALELGVESILARTRRHWAAILDSIVVPEVPDAAMMNAITQASEETTLIIACQQAKEGSVVAGHNYCLAYVHDQYGVSRALLDMGLHQRAREILNFYWNIFQREGIIHNAQSIGRHTRFHVHENDDVKMTGWLLIQAFDYLAASGDEAFLLNIAPMLAWCADAQERNLVEGMLPFNGDETYVAGKILPRSALDDGSAESTMLYIASVRRFNDWCVRHGYGTTNEISRRRMATEDAWQRYRANFFDGPRLMLNNPQRACLVSRPRFRHGVCQEQLSDCFYRDWLELAVNGRYACPACFSRAQTATKESQRFFLPSVAVTPAFIGLTVAEPDEQAAMLDAAMTPFTGSSVICYPETILPGYELGMLLYALAEIGDPRCPAVAKRLLEMRDRTSAWVEYYTGARGQRTRCRPWESAINMCGLLNAARKGTLVRKPGA